MPSDVRHWTHSLHGALLKGTSRYSSPHSHPHNPNFSLCHLTPGRFPRASSSRAPCALLITTDQALISTSPSPASPGLSPLTTHRPPLPRPSQSLPSPTVPRDSRYPSLWNLFVITFSLSLPPTSPPFTTDIINEGGGLLGLSFTFLGVRCVVRHTPVPAFPSPSVAARQLIHAITGNEGLFI